MGYLGVRGKLIHEKNLKMKHSCQSPFKSVFFLSLLSDFVFLSFRLLFVSHFSLPYTHRRMK
jgi:hypothetical protein